MFCSAACWKLDDIVLKLGAQNFISGLIESSCSLLLLALAVFAPLVKEHLVARFGVEIVLYWLLLYWFLSEEFLGWRQISVIIIGWIPCLNHWRSSSWILLYEFLAVILFWILSPLLVCLFVCGIVLVLELEMGKFHFYLRDFRHYASWVLVLAAS